MNATSLISSLIVAILYCYTAFRSIAGGDSGELIAEACVGGVAHPPGYPLFTILTRLVIAVPIFDDVSPAQRANLLCCFFGAIASGCIAYSVQLMSSLLGLRERTGFSIEAVAAAALFAFSPISWEYSIGSEVFALNNLLCSVLLALAMEYQRARQMRAAYLGAWICGLGISNQHTILFFEIPLVLWVLYFGRDTIRLKELAILSIMFLAGLCPYAYIFLAAQSPTRGSWGDTASLKGFFTHLLRMEYGTLKLSPKEDNTEGTMYRVIAYFTQSSKDFLYIGMIFALIGLGVSVGLIRPGVDQSRAMSKKKTRNRPTKRGLSVASGVLCAQGLYIGVFNYLANIPLDKPLARAVQSRFWMQPNIVIAIWCGIGMTAVSKRFSNTNIKYCIKLVYVAIAMTQCLSRFQQLNHSESSGNILKSFGLSVLATIPQGALLLSHTDINWNTIRYLQECEDLRPDVIHLSLQLMPFPWFKRQHQLYPSVSFPKILAGVSTEVRSNGNTQHILRFLRKNIDVHDIYLDLHAVNDAEIGHGGQYHEFVITPVGMLWRVEKSDGSTEISQWFERVSRVGKTYDKIFLLKVAEQSDPGSWEYAAACIYWDGVYQKSLHLLGHAIAMRSSVTADTLLDYVTYLEIAADDLENCLVALDQMGTLSFPASDVTKNAALTFLSYTKALEVALKAKVHGVTETQLRRVRSRAIPIVQRYIKIGTSDPNIDMFKAFLQQETN